MFLLSVLCKEIQPITWPDVIHRICALVHYFLLFNWFYRATQARLSIQLLKFLQQVCKKARDDRKVLCLQLAV